MKNENQFLKTIASRPGIFYCLKKTADPIGYLQKKWNVFVPKGYCLLLFLHGANFPSSCSVCVWMIARKKRTRQVDSPIL